MYIFYFLINIYHLPLFSNYLILSLVKANRNSSSCPVDVKSGMIYNIYFNWSIFFLSKANSTAYWSLWCFRRILYTLSDFILIKTFMASYLFLSLSKMIWPKYYSYLSLSFTIDYNDFMSDYSIGEDWVDKLRKWDRPELTFGVCFFKFKQIVGISV